MSDRNPKDQEFLSWLDRRVFELMHSAEVAERISEMVRSVSRREKRTTGEAWNVFKKKVLRECSEQLADESRSREKFVAQLQEEVATLRTDVDALYAALDIMNPSQMS